MREIERNSAPPGSPVSLRTLARRIAREHGVSSDALAAGGRSRPIARARAELAVTWVRYLAPMLDEALP